MQNRDLDSSGLAGKTSQCKGPGAEGRKAEVGLQAGRSRSSEVTKVMGRGWEPESQIT